MLKKTAGEEKFTEDRLNKKEAAVLLAEIITAIRLKIGTGCGVARRRERGT